MKAALSFAIAVLFSAVLFAVLPIHGEDAVYDETIRLHVLANSDSDADQSVKLSVRDAVLVTVEELLRDASSRDEAMKMLADNSDKIRECAAERLRSLGYPDTVAVRFGEEHYPTRVYDAFTLPAGTYTSLRVEIGEAAGRNWWCILFPSVCGRFARGGESEDAIAEDFVAAGFTPEEYRLITENDRMPYKVRFWLLEEIAKWFGKP